MHVYSAIIYNYSSRCPDSITKSDLLAYLERIILYCHQLNITSKVKADVHSVSGELIVSGLDSATSLIQVSLRSCSLSKKSQREWSLDFWQARCLAG